MTSLPENIKDLLCRYLGEEHVLPAGKVCHTRSKDRGGVLRLPLEDGGSVVVKVWRIRNVKERIKSAAYISNGWREWRMHRYIYRKGIRVPEPLFFSRLKVVTDEYYEVMGIEDLGETEQGLPYLKRLIAAEDESRITTFENSLVNITTEIVGLGIVDIDHQLNNFLIDKVQRLMRIDFECARRPLFGIVPREEFAEMIARLLTSHIYAVQPDVGLSKGFAKQLYNRLDIGHQVRSLVQSSVNKKLENQRIGEDVVSAVVLPR